MTQITLVAPDISCDHCIRSIEQAVSRLAGVRFIAGDPNLKQVTLEYDAALTGLSAIEAAMEEEGYPVKR